MVYFESITDWCIHISDIMAIRFMDFGYCLYIFVYDHCLHNILRHILRKQLKLPQAGLYHRPDIRFSKCI